MPPYVFIPFYHSNLGGHMRLKQNEILLFKGGQGRFHKATAVFSDVDAANAYLASSPGEAVIAVVAGIILIAAIDDLGIPLPSTAQV
jgi:hypothetical protein